MTSIQGDSTTFRRLPLRIAIQRLLAAVGCGLMGFLALTGPAPAADAQTKLTRPALTVSSSDPYNLACTVSGQQISGVSGPSGSVTFTDVTEGQTLGTASLGFPTLTILGPEIRDNSFNFGPVASGDFNGDGIPDLVTTGGDILVSLGKGDGTFQSPVTTVASIDYNVDGVAVGDFNGDGKLDLVVANTGEREDGYGTTVTVFLGNGDGTFQQGKDFGTQYGPTAIVVGDFNGDHILDLAVANIDSAISVLLGNGDGTFQPQIGYGASAEWNGIVAADFNHDGVLDIAAMSTVDKVVEVLLGNGDGTFQMPQQYESVGEYGPTSIAAGDFRKNGFPDLVVGIASAGTVNLNILPNQGNGTFGTPLAYTLTGQVVEEVVVEDFDGDGDLDIAGIGNEGIGLLLGKGDETFQTPSINTGLSGGSVTVAGDFSSDGYYDLALPGGYLALNRQSTAGGTLSSVDLKTDTATHTLQCSYGGDTNYAASTSSTAAVTLPSATTPAFSLTPGTYEVPETVTLTDSVPASTIYYTTNGTPPTSSSTHYTGPIDLSGAETIAAIAYQPGYLPSGTATGSYTLQAAAPLFSLASGSYASGTTVTITDHPSEGAIYYTTDGMTPSASSTPYTGPITLEASETLRAIAIAPDFVNSAVASAAYTVATPAEIPVISPASNFGNGSTSVTISDSVSGAAIYYTTNGSIPTSHSTPYTGSFTVSAAPFFTVQIKAIAIIPGSGPSPVATATFTSTSTVSALAVAGTDPYTLSCAVTGAALPALPGPTGTATFTDTTTGQELGTASLGASSATFEFLQTAPLPGSSQNSGLTLGDFNGDGIPDAVTLNGEYVSIYLGNGDGSFQAPELLALGNYSVSSAAVGDFNGDGKLDLALGGSSSEGSPVVLILFGDGDGTFQTPLIEGLSIEPGQMVAADFNGDGFSDLAVIVPAGGRVRIYLGGPQQIESAGTFVTGINPQSAVAGDFNGDGRLDLAVINDKGVILLPGNGDGTFRPGLSQSIASLPESIVKADFNNDGKLDLAISTADGIWMLLGNGDGTFQHPASPTMSVAVDRLVAADFNGDGFADLAFSPSNGVVNVALGKDNGEFQAVRTYGLAGSWSQLIAADLNGDGRIDLLTTTTLTNVLTAALNYQRALASASISDITVVAGTQEVHQLDCSYSGDSNYPSSTSSPVTEGFPQASPPAFSLTVGNYPSEQTVSILDSYPGTSIYYTNNGSTPTASSKPYTGPVPVTSTVTLKAIAIGPIVVNSPVSTSTYTVTKPPAFSVPGGTYSMQQMVTLTDATANAAIYYTTDGTTPGKTSTQYSTPVSIAGNVTLKAVAVAPGNLFSTVTSATYQMPQSATTTKLTTSATTVNVSQSFALTATVTGTTPTGSVTFKAGSATLGTATLASGMGTLTVSLGAAGAYSVTAAYSGDAENTTSTSSAVTVTAKKVAAVLTWNTPHAIDYGTAVGATQEDATANVAGTFRYYPPAGWKPKAGTHTLTATFTPTDTSQYSVTTATVALTVDKAVPVLTWATPSPITYGTAVGTAQQDAKANVAGTFSYYPPAGWKPIVGSHTMTATFTPTDTTDYAGSRQVSVTLTVNAAP